MQSFKSSQSRLKTTLEAEDTGNSKLVFKYTIENQLSSEQS